MPLRIGPGPQRKIRLRIFLSNIFGKPLGTHAAIIALKRGMATLE